MLCSAMQTVDHQGTQPLGECFSGILGMLILYAGLAEGQMSDLGKESDRAHSSSSYRQKSVPEEHL